MSLFQSVNPKEKEHKGIIGSFSVDNIKWEPEDDRQASLIAKRYPYEDFPNGSYLQVAQSQMAVFTNNMNAGNSLEDDGTGVSQVSVFVGPCKIKLDTGDSRFAPFRNLTHKLTDGASAFHSVVYFFNTTYMNELKWGTTDPVLVQDPEELVNVHVRAYGLFGAHIDQVDKAQASVNARKFIMKVVGTREAFTRDELTDFMRAKILEYVPDLLAKEMVNEGVGVLKLPSHLSEFSNIIQDKLSGNFDQFGLTLDNFSFHSINPLESDLEAINQMKVEKQRAKLEAEGSAAKMDIESEALARKRAREGYSYQQERGMDVMQSAASNEGSASSGFLGAGMGLGMGVGVGGAVGAGFSNLAKQTVDSVVQPTTGTNTKKICPKCGFSNPTEAKFCLNCGNKFDERITCPNCGKINPAGSRFCMYCGGKLMNSNVCPNCGAKLEEEAKFCPNCGAKIG